MKTTFVLTIIIYLIATMLLYPLISVYPINNYSVDDFYNAAYLPYSFDSVLWMEKAINIKSACSVFSLNCFNDVLILDGLNVKVIAIYGYLFVNDHLEFNQYLYFSINLILSFSLVRQLLRLIQTKTDNFVRVYLYLIIILFLPYFFYTQIQLDKNFFSIIFMMSILNSFGIYKTNILILLLTSFAGFFRNYTTLILFYFLSLKFIPCRIKIYIFIILAALLINYISINTNENALMSYSTIANFNDSGSLSFFYALNNLATIPVIGLFGNLIRIFINSFIGITHIYSIDFSLNTIYSLSYISLSLSFTLFLYSLFKYKKNLRNIDPFFRIVFLFLMLVSIVPFLQPRYYSPLIIPFIYIFIYLRSGVKVSE